MTTQASTNGISLSHTQVSAFERFAGLCAILTGVVGFLYAISFIILHNVLLSSLFLLLEGLLFTAVLIAVYQRLAATNPAFALWAFLLSGAGALGTLIHGGYDLANALHPEGLNATLANAPSGIDPRGLLSFGLTGLGLLVISWLIGRSNAFPRALSSLGYLAAALLIILYIARLIILTPSSQLIAIPALLSGFVVNPIWYLWLGLVLWRGQSNK
jgi:hypothetical protein